MAMAKQIKAALANFSADKVSKRGNTIEVKRGYFYTFGKTARDWADSVKTALKSSGITVDVKCRDDWAAWPKTSYFVAIVPIED